MQVLSRFLIVWVIAYIFPDTVSPSPAYTSMLLAWSITEIIRYSYFALNLKNGQVPDYLTWLRYNTFFVLYPVGIASECWLVFSATKPAAKWDWRVECALWLVLAVYVPGEYFTGDGRCVLMFGVGAWILFTHMMAQRQKVIRGLNARKSL
jgi:very-long-chain (3R)-3-hydroxyacyl-CoA dehydratase